MSQQAVHTNGSDGDGARRRPPRPAVVLVASAMAVGVLAALAWPLLETAFVRGYVEYFFVQMLYQLGCY